MRALEYAVGCGVLTDMVNARSLIQLMNVCGVG